jgi:hypothetical protein
MQIDLAELRKFLPTGGGRLSFEFRDGHGRLIASAKLDVVSPRDESPIHVTQPDRGSAPCAEDPPGPNFLSILT